MYTKTKLKNGLQLILSPLQSTKAVTVLILLPVGSRYETPSTNGVSHFVEHLMFKGTKKRPTSLDLTKELDSVGAEFNAFTAKDQTGYYIKVASDKIELAFDILSDMLFNSTFSALNVEKERGVIAEEINMYEDNPLIHIENVFEQTLFSPHPLSWLISGPRKVIKEIPRAKILAYKNQFYQPGNLVISVAGNFDQKAVLALTRRYFNPAVKKVKKISFSKITISQNQPRIKVIYKKTEQVQLSLGFPAYSLRDKNIFALSLLSVILGGNMSSRLFILIREQHSLAYYIKASAHAYQDTGALVVQAGLDKRRLNQAIKLILQELKRFKTETVALKELNEAKEFLKGKLVLDLEDSENVADWFGKQQILLGKIFTPEQQLKKIFAVTPSQIKKVANDIIRPSRLNLALIGPFKTKQPFLPLLKV